MTDWLPSLLQTTDTLFPTGAYAHSGGLETLVALGVVTDPVSLGAFLGHRVVPMLGEFELPYLGFAMAAAAAADIDDLIALDHEYAAAKLPRETRTASAQIGTQRLRLLTRLPAQTHSGAAGARATVESFAAAVARGAAGGHAVIVAGLQAHVQGAPVDAAMAAHFYSILSGYASAALKLIRIGQEGCQRVLAEALALAPVTLARARTVSRAGAGWCDPALDLAAARHERAFARLFIS